MVLYVINPFREAEPHFPIVGAIPQYNSMIWNLQFYGFGYFEITVEATEKNRSLLTNGRILVRECDINQSTSPTVYNNAMIIRRTEVVYEADAGYVMKVSGKSLKDILTQRVVWEQYNAEDRQLPLIVSDLLFSEISEPAEAVAELLSVASDALNTYINEYLAARTDYTDAMTTYYRAVDDYGMNSQQAKDAKAIADHYAEVLETATEIMNKQENLVNHYTESLPIQSNRQIPYFEYTPIDAPANPPELDAQLMGDNLGEWIREVFTEKHIGWDLELSENSISFKFLSSSDRSDTVIFSPEFDNLLSSDYVKSYENFKNAALIGGDGDGLERILTYIGTTSAATRFEEFIAAEDVSDNNGTMSLATYKKKLRQYGNSQIAALKKTKSITGEIDTDGVFKIDQDFFLGDVVAVEDGAGNSATVRLTEVIYSDEASGYRVTGMFSEWEV